MLLLEELCESISRWGFKKIIVYNGHGGMRETAYIMGIAPESVHLDRLGIESGKSTGRGEYFRKAGVSIVSDGWSLDYPNAYCGDDPYGCNERIGKAAIRIEAERLANAIRVFKEDKHSLLKFPVKK